MKVVATREGYYGGRVRKVGEVFDLVAKTEMSERWMLDVTTREGKAFVSGIDGEKATTKNIHGRDTLNGERIAAGGVAEQLAIALEEKRTLQQEVAELRAQLKAVKAEKVAPRKPNPSPTPAVVEKEDQQVPSAPTRVRRRSAPAST